MALYLFDYIKKESAKAALSPENNQEILKTIFGTDDNYWIGAARPKVVIVEFGDFACPYCKNTFPKIREISTKYKDNVRIIFRDYPVVAEYSPALALAARCAGEQGLFWVMHDKLFINQGVNTQEEIYELAKQSGVNTKKFADCYEKEKYLKQIDNDYLDGSTLKITGTPTWFINGLRVEGDIPYDTFINIIENLINS